MTPAEAPAPPERVRLVLISGLSGSGKSSAAKCLEDLGFYCVDNLPLPLLRAFLEDPAAHVPDAGRIAVVSDVRARGMGEELPGVLDAIDRRRIDTTLLFLECSDDVLVRRYSETRRRHPLAPDESAIEGIRRERDLLAEVRGRADRVIDTTDFTIHEIKAEVWRHFGDRGAANLVVSVTSFGFKRGLPRGSDIVFDVRHLPNPYFEEELRALSGLDEPVRSYLAESSDFPELASHIAGLLAFQLPRFAAENRSYLTVSIGCTGGQHRSVAMAETVAARLRESGWAIRVYHRELGTN